MKLKNFFVQGAIPPELIRRSIERHHSHPEIGAHGIFLGQVRADRKEEGTVKAIIYTAYETMALEQAATIREDVFAKYPLTCMHLYHSIGPVLAGDLCLFVFTSSGHRNAAIEAMQELVERIKNELPIWGKEITDTGKSLWKINT